MTDNALANIDQKDALLAAEAATKNDLNKLTPDQRTQLYGAVCRSVGLNPLTQPFQYITLNGKLTLYAAKGATDQLRKINGISITKIEKEIVGDVLMVTAYAQDKTGRMDSDIGAVALGRLQGDALANAHMKAITKAKRRVTLSIAGLGFLDESEVETIPNARRVHVNMETGEIETPAAPQRSPIENMSPTTAEVSSASQRPPQRVTAELVDDGAEWQRASSHFHAVLNEADIDGAGKREWLAYKGFASTKDVPADTLHAWANQIKDRPEQARTFIEGRLATLAPPDDLNPGEDELPTPAGLREGDAF